ncbi:MAG: hypothetical protein ABIG46_02460 [Candidatus Omnitrophota bacterium]|nr:hypothetical protein [Candidatus Omnitrophota bacterium]
MRIFIFGLACIISSAGVAFAHPPKSIIVKVSNATLDVVITHPVAERTSHYIFNVTVKVNNQQAIEQKFTVQNDSDKQVALYYIPGLKKDDIIEVRASCNKGGDLSETVIVE